MAKKNQDLPTQESQDYDYINIRIKDPTIRAKRTPISNIHDLVDENFSSGVEESKKVTYPEENSISQYSGNNTTTSDITRSKSVNPA